MFIFSSYFVLEFQVGLLDAIAHRILGYSDRTLDISVIPWLALLLSVRRLTICGKSGD
ncbi:MAG: hypothetical protein WCA35_02490 [Kovacikia sp.]